MKARNRIVLTAVALEAAAAAVWAYVRWVRPIVLPQQRGTGARGAAAGPASRRRPPDLRGRR